MSAGWRRRRVVAEPALLLWEQYDLSRRRDDTYQRAGPDPDAVTSIAYQRAAHDRYGLNPTTSGGQQFVWEASAGLTEARPPDEAPPGQYDGGNYDTPHLEAGRAGPQGPPVAGAPMALFAQDIRWEQHYCRLAGGGIAPFYCAGPGNEADARDAVVLAVRLEFDLPRPPARLEGPVFLALALRRWPADYGNPELIIGGTLEVAVVPPLPPAELTAAAGLPRWWNSRGTVLHALDPATLPAGFTPLVVEIPAGFLATGRVALRLSVSLPEPPAVYLHWEFPDPDFGGTVAGYQHTGRAAAIGAQLDAASPRLLYGLREPLETTPEEEPDQHRESWHTARAARARTRTTSTTLRRR